MRGKEKKCKTEMFVQRRTKDKPKSDKKRRKEGTTWNAEVEKKTN